MDKYDVMFIIDTLINKLNEWADTLNEQGADKVYEKYNRMKYEWMMRQYYVLRAKKSSEYWEKQGGRQPHTIGVQKVGTLDNSVKGQRSI